MDLCGIHAIAKSYARIPSTDSAEFTAQTELQRYYVEQTRAVTRKTKPPE